jgi:L-gulono-1,4-lactone dehydrogenase
VATHLTLGHGEANGALPYSVRQRWQNHSKNQSSEPLRIYHPQSLDDIVKIVHDAELERCTVRAVGSHHAWSDIALGTEFVLEPQGLARVLPVDATVLRPETDSSLLVYCEAGIRLRELNTWLARHGLALANMGGYDQQTVAGVMSTATHGSGITFGPIASLVASIDLVASGGRVLRIELRDGPTNAQAFRKKYPGRLIIQDDGWFNAVSVGLGLMGVIYAVHLRVERKYWLKETRSLSTWSRVRGDLEPHGIVEEHRHYELLLNPYADRNDEHRVLVTTRNVIQRPQYFPDARRWRNPVVEFFSALPVASSILDLLLTAFPKSTPKAIDAAIKALVDREYTDLSYRVLNIGTANLLRAYSSEIAVPFDSRQLHVAAVDELIEVAARYRRLGDVYQTAPIALRFVKQSSQYLAMMYERNVMTIEFIILANTEGGLELLAAYEEALYKHEGRPHWGQFNMLVGGRSRIESLYPALSKWEEIRKDLNSSGVFDAPFARRVGLR